MSRMIPSILSPEVKSAAERHVFEWFRDAPNTDEWVVLHSLGITNHASAMYGEIDFFVLVPYMGLFALEVKGGRVTRNEGIWYFTDRYGNINQKARGPFEQANEGMHSIIEDIKAKLDPSHKKLEKVFYGCGVMFPDIEYTATGCDEEQWQVFDCNDDTDVNGYIHRLFYGTRDKWEKSFGCDLPFEKLPTPDDIEYIAKILRGDFDKVVALKVQIQNSEERLIKLTGEQYNCLDQIEDNKRAMIEGGAGTGKTLIAIEEAKRAVANGLKVALLCYNKRLGEWLKMQFEGKASNLCPAYVGTFHSFMLNIVDRANIPRHIPDSAKEKSIFFSEDLPECACIALNQLNQYGTERFDKIIIDEAQDLITPKYLNVIDKCLCGGISRGKWTFYGDFCQQAINSKALSGDEMKSIVESKAAYIRFKLTINCRNTKEICDEIVNITDFVPPSEIWSTVEGIPVRHSFYQDSAEEKAILIYTIEELLNEGIAPKDICILSPLKKENSIVSKISEYNIQDFSPKYIGNKLSFSTIKSFKGLEKPVIILVDIDEDAIADLQLMYVALSRARTGLYIIEFG